MCKVVSIIPPQNEGEHTRTQGTKVLLDNGEYLRGVRSIRLECDPDNVWKAFIEVAPTNQKQIDALIAGVEVNKPLTNADQVKSIDEQIKELEFKRDVLNGKLPLGSDGITFVSGGYIKGDPEGVPVGIQHHSSINGQLTELLKEDGNDKASNS